MILLFGTLLALLLLGAPIFVALGGAASVYILANGIQPRIAVQQGFAAIDQFQLLAVPFFVLAGNLMNASAITDRIYAFCRCLCGHISGGLAHVNILGSVIFSGMSGTAVADAGGLGTIELKAMRDEGFDIRFAVGVTAASATLGPIIPPSLAMIVYGMQANASVGRLFMAGIVPGLLMALALHVMVYVIARRGDLPRSVRPSLAELGRRFATAVPALMTPVIIIGGMMAGVFTPTEAAVVAALYALFLDVVLYRAITLDKLLRVLFETFETTAVIMIMVASSVIFGWVLVREKAAQGFTELMLQVATTPVEMMLVLNVILLVAGMFMDTIAIILIATPFFLPALTAMKIDVVQFGVVMVLNLMIGLMTPPVGLLLFVLSRIAQLDFWTTTKACAPFMIPLFVVLVLISLVPGLTLWLPNLVYR